MTEVTLFGGESPFDAIKRTDESGEFWSARDLMPLLGYSKWERFEDAIDRARIAISNSGLDADVHASRLRENGQLGGARVDYRLTRYGAYMTAMNSDVRKSEVAAAQSYFAVRTREAETSAPQPRREPTKRELAQWVIELEDRAELAEAKVAALEPAAQSWTALADRNGDYSVREAAQILDRDPAISTGQNRLFAYLREIGWLGTGNEPYQAQVDLGRVVRRATGAYTRPDGVEVGTSQPRITAKGLHELHKRLGGSGPLLLSA